MSRTTSSRAGMPFGKSVARRRSRLTPPVLRRPSVAARAVAPRRVVVLFRRAAVDVPATPCARRRWAPSAAARAKVFPHSGQSKIASVDAAPLEVADAFLRVADPVFRVADRALRAVDVFVLVAFLARGMCSPTSRIALGVTAEAYDKVATLSP